MAHQVILNNKFSELKKRFLNEPYPEINCRIDRLNSLKKSLLRFQPELVSALNQDYGYRSEFDSVLADILPTIQHIKYTIKKLPHWAKNERRSSGLLLAPSTIKVQYQPLGLVGIIVPWNFPIFLSLGPIATAIAAGNKIMLKLSEFTPETNKVIIEILKPLSADITVIEGETDIAQAFSSLPFDHLLFTGSTAVGKHVMRAAAANLTPVTLELGGKSPTIIAPDMDIKTAVSRLMIGKCLNAGQICVAPDYVLLPQDKIDDFIKCFISEFNKMYPEGLEDKNFSSIINQAQFSRLKQYLEEAQLKGATISSVTQNAINEDKHKMLIHLVTDVTDDMLIMKNEIFGPLLPIIGYDTLNDAIAYINDRDRPLALYLMSFNQKIQKEILKNTHSGGVCINDTLMHVSADDAPFGGIGASGMGQYHGKEGFITFSKAKTVLTSYRFSPRSRLLNYNKKFMKRVLSKLFIR
ncbi:coniferyl aldehyde dehydrogenase [Pseudoalteromonas denitrificans]